MEQCRSRGFSLIEVMVSTLLMMIILFAFEAVGFRSLYVAKERYLYSFALNQVNNFHERLWVMQYDRSILPGLIAEWNEENKTVLPNGSGVVIDHASYIEVALSWGQQHDCLKAVIGSSECVRKIISLEKQ